MGIIFTVIEAQQRQNLKQEATGSDIVLCETTPEIIKEENPPIPNIKELEQTTENLEKAVKSEGFVIAQSKKEKVATIKSQANRRKQLLIETMEANPKKALEIVENTENKEEIEASTNNCLEKPTEISGELQISHYDYDDKVSEDQYFIEQDNKKIQVHAPYGIRNIDQVETTQVEAKGYLMDSNFLLASDSLTDDFPQTADNSNFSYDVTTFSGTQRIAVILANFANTNVSSPAKSTIQGTIINKLNSYYQENSYGKIGVTADTFGWYKMESDSNCDMNRIIDEGVLGTGSDINFSSYTHVMIIAPTNCEWSGSAQIGTFSQRTPQGVYFKGGLTIVSSNSLTGATPSHEMGHSFKNKHASFATDEYGDLFDVMGKSKYNGNFNALHKEKSGWLKENENLKTVTASGTYSILPINATGQGTKALKILTPSGQPYFIEYRQPIGFDANFNSISGTNVFQGALIHTTSTVNKSDSALANPTSSNGAQSALTLNKTYQIPNSQISITTTALSSSALSVNITMPNSPTATPTPLPTATPNPTQGDLTITKLELTNQAGQVKTSFATNEKIYVRVTVKNNSNATIANNPAVKTYIYKKAPNPIPFNSPLPEGVAEYIELTHGAFTANSEYRYESYPTGQYSSSFTQTHNSFYHTVPGAYTTRAFINPNKVYTESDFSNNQPLSVTYTITGNTTQPTPTPTRAVTPFPTTIPTAGPTPNSNTSIKLSLLLNGLGKAGDSVNPNNGGNTNPIKKEKVGLIVLIDSNDEIVLYTSISVTYNPTQGDFQGSIHADNAISTGRYTLRIWFPKYLMYESPNFILTKNAANTASLRLIAGDIKLDNKLDILDYNILVTCFSELLPQKNCSTVNDMFADINDDGIVNQFDYNLFLRELSARTPR